MSRLERMIISAVLVSLSLLIAGLISSFSGISVPVPLAYGVMAGLYWVAYKHAPSIAKYLTKEV